MVNLFQLLTLALFNTNFFMCSKWYNCRIRIPSDKIITFSILSPSEHRLLPFSSFTKFLVYLFWLSCRPKWNCVLIGYHLFDKIKPCIKQDEGTCLFLRATCQLYLVICSHFNEDGGDWRSQYSACLRCSWKWALRTASSPELCRRGSITSRKNCGACKNLAIRRS